MGPGGRDRPPQGPIARNLERDRAIAISPKTSTTASTRSIQTHSRVCSLDAVGSVASCVVLLPTPSIGRHSTRSVVAWPK